MLSSLAAWVLLVGCGVEFPSQHFSARAEESAVLTYASLAAPLPKDEAVLAIERAVQRPLLTPLVTLVEPPKFLPTPRSSRPKDAYEGLKFDVEEKRRELAWRQAQGEDVSADARNELSKAVPALIERWKGTRWSYSGTTTVPKKGAIACGYFVSTVLLHAGFDVDRVDLSRQASEQIIRTLVPDDQIERFHRESRDTVVKRVEKLGEGVYIAGLDTHIGFLVNQKGKPVQFCHSTERNRKQGVICELARESPSFKSKYTVLGRLGEGPLLDAWLAGDRLPTARKLQPQASVMTPRPKLEVATPKEEPLPDFEWFYEDWARVDLASATL